MEHFPQKEQPIESHDTVLANILSSYEGRDFVKSLSHEMRRTFLAVVAVSGIFLTTNSEVFAQVKPEVKNQQHVESFDKAKDIKEFLYRDARYKDSVYKSTHPHMETVDSSGHKKHVLVYDQAPQQKIAPMNQQVFYKEALEKQDTLIKSGFPVKRDGVWDKDDEKVWEEYQVSRKKSEEEQIKILKQKLAQDDE